MVLKGAPANSQCESMEVEADRYPTKGKLVTFATCYGLKGKAYGASGVEGGGCEFLPPITRVMIRFRFRFFFSSRREKIASRVCC